MKNNLKFFMLVAVLLLAGLGLVTPSSAEAAVRSRTYFAKSGLDTTGGGQLVLSKTSLNQLKKADDNKLTHDFFWPNGSFDEAKYVEFNFSKQNKSVSVPKGAKMRSAKLTIEYTNTNVPLEDVKLEVWDGKNWSHEHRLNMPAVGEDMVQVVDLSSYIDTRAEANNLKVRFLAHDSGASQALFDVFKFNVRYKK